MKEKKKHTKNELYYKEKDSIVFSRSQNAKVRDSSKVYIFSTWKEQIERKKRNARTHVGIRTSTDTFFYNNRQ